MADIKTQDISFFSGPKVKVAARVYRPVAEKDHHTGIVMCHGFAGIKEGVLPGLATLLAEAGYTPLTFDFRGFGGSEGPVGRLVPDEQVEDTVHALEFWLRKVRLIRTESASMAPASAVVSQLSQRPTVIARRPSRFRCLSPPVAVG
jgi:dienelactone hydrolase